MGNILPLIFEKKGARILMVGLDSSGKTTIMYRLKLGEYVQTVPTVGYNIETIKHKKAPFTIWDFGGQDKIRPLWKYYFPNTNGIIFVIDSGDRDRIHDAAAELQKMISEDDLKHAVLLVFANKQDIPDAMKPDEIKDKLGLELVKWKWHIQPACASSGEGLQEGLEWLAKALNFK